MGKHTKENGLIRYDNNIFSRVKRFFWNKFWRNRDVEYYFDTENADEDLERDLYEKEEPVKKRSLYNFDAEDEENISNEISNTSEEPRDTGDLGNLVRQEGAENIYNAPIAQDVEKLENGEMEEQFIGMGKREPTVEEEKEELERKLKRYYESIKKIANLSL